MRVGIVIHQPRDNTSTLVHHLLLEMCDVILGNHVWPDFRGLITTKK